MTTDDFDLFATPDVEPFRTPPPGTFGNRAPVALEARNGTETGKGGHNDAARNSAALDGLPERPAERPVLRRYEVTFDRFTAVIVAPSAGRAKSHYAVDLADSGWVERAGDAFRSIRCRSLGPAGAEAAFVRGGAAWASEVDPKRDAQASADAWNAAHPVGTPVRYWMGWWEGERECRVSSTRSLAQSMGSHASVWVVGEASCIALSHVEAM